MSYSTIKFQLFIGESLYCFDNLYNGLTFDGVDGSILAGRMTEWSIVTVSKTVVRVSVPRVRIPLLPPEDFATVGKDGRAV